MNRNRNGKGDRDRTADRVAYEAAVTEYASELRGICACADAVAASHAQHWLSRLMSIVRRHLAGES